MSGQTLNEFLETKGNNVALREELCDLGIMTVTKMIFEDNFIHGDLHPGNILFNDEGMILLDAGIAKKFNRNDYDLLVGTLTAFIRGDGAAAADCIIKDSAVRMKMMYPPKNVEDFRAVLKEMADEARRSSYFDKLGNYLNTLCDAAATNNICMNQSFVSIALTIRVMEGLALALNKEGESRLW